MKRLLFVLFLTLSIEANCQQLSFNKILALEGKSYREIQGTLLRYGLSIIDDTINYTYFPYAECDPPKFGDDSCI